MVAGLMFEKVKSQMRCKIYDFLKIIAERKNLSIPFG
jgi:hypothetical protein